MRMANFIEGLLFMIGFMFLCLVILTEAPLSRAAGVRFQHGRRIDRPRLRRERRLHLGAQRDRRLRTGLRAGEAGGSRRERQRIRERQPSESPAAR